MHETDHDELLSAYLDGELTAQEQGLAERLLADNPQARRLFEELRAIRTRLQELPRQQAPERFETRVLRSAEQKLLVSRDPDVDAAVPWRERIRRPLAYVAVVLAASVLISIVIPDASRLEGTKEPVALAPRSDKDESGQTARTAAPPSVTAPEIGKQAGAAEEDLELAGASGNLLVVTCEVTPGAADKEVFRQVLARNQIALGDAAGPTSGLMRQRRLGREVEALRDQTTKTEASSEKSLEVVYVEATREQLEATLAEMAEQRDAFITVDVGAADPRGGQKSWEAQYSRGKGGLLQQRQLDLPAQERQALPAPSANPVERTEAAAPAQAGTAIGQTQGRARAYAMPAEGLGNQRAGGVGGAGPTQLGLSVDGEAPGTLRALFVLKVAEPQPPAEDPAAKPAQKQP